MNDGDSAGDAQLRIARVLCGFLTSVAPRLATLRQRLNGRALNFEQVTVADCCLVPQLYNARRFNVEL